VHLVVNNNFKRAAYQTSVAVLGMFVVQAAFVRNLAIAVEAASPIQLHCEGAVEVYAYYYSTYYHTNGFEFQLLYCFSVDKA
jgi:hypothetical protein